MYILAQCGSNISNCSPDNPVVQHNVRNSAPHRKHSCVCNLCGTPSDKSTPRLPPGFGIQDSLTIINRKNLYIYTKMSERHVKLYYIYYLKNLKIIAKLLQTIKLMPVITENYENYIEIV